jgi:acyl carrier protein
MLDCVINAASKVKPTEDIDEDTILYGSGGVFDSLDLVEFIIELERQIEEETGEHIRITTDQAFSFKRNPFLNIQTVVDFINNMETK